MVSASRISPTRMMSGSWRSAARQRLGEVRGVLADLALADHALAIDMRELDRVLDGDDVVVPAAFM
jgi:hypothetical protein